jgi:hypothetical protein
VRPSPVLIYTSSRILLFVATAAVSWLVGFRGLLLLAVALLVSGLLSFVLLSGQRDAMSAAVVETGGRFKRRLDERTTAEDAADDAWRAEHGAEPPSDRPPDRPTGT